MLGNRAISRGEPVASDGRDRQGEPQRVMGQPIWDLGPGSRPDEPQRVMGYPVDSVGPSAADRARLLALARELAHPIRAFQQWVRRRRLGPYTDDP